MPLAAIEAPAYLGEGLLLDGLEEAHLVDVLEQAQRVVEYLLRPLFDAAVLAEYELLAKVLSPTEILKGMWEAGARLCRMQGEIGTLAPGARAHFTVVDADPFTNIAALGKPDETLRLVVKNGAIVHDRRAA